ncbi:MAG: multidrug ABC transporter ATP-binding protein [Planctomycetes bacterium]|nr:multidrug ABC transporter ATP-binding protein [Planctomycetota bacterium]
MEAATDPTVTRTPAVRLRGLCKTFGEKVAVDRLDLEVQEGEFFGFLGPNGAGKSTTIKMMCGLLEPDAGDASVLGVDVAKEPLVVRRSIGVLPEEIATYERLTPLELLAFVGRLHGLAADAVANRSNQLLDLMELAEADRRKMVLDFSMGMRKKVALACALVHGPRVLFLDEPFNGIDAVTVRAIRDVLQDAVARGVTIFFSSHILELVERLCTRIAIITHGKLRVCGTLDGIRAQMQRAPETSLEDMFVDLAGGVRAESRGLEFLG